MVVKHRISLTDYEVLVFENEDTTFHVTIQSMVNPLSRGNVLDQFSDEQEAIDAAERFHWMYTLAKENGYYLKQHYFTKPQKRGIHISIMKDCNMTREQLVLQLQA
ncbi:MAG: hypothetical protein K0Q59_3002 [Paenibacillus sp.]|jgi:hypothetical protein|nr:hypothetical protein [Paenibacillus sp.]